MIQYILECIAFQLLFLIIYDLFLKEETFFQWNRAYLIGTYVLSILLPWVKIEAFKTNLLQDFSAYPTFLWNINNLGGITLTAEKTDVFSMPWYALLFLFGVAIATLLLAYKFFKIGQLKQKGEVHYFESFTKVLLKKSNVAFSFFKTIFMGDEIRDEEYKSIIEHELVHIQQKHSLDLLFFELMRIVAWCNPLVYVYQRRISELHEFIADAQVSKTNRKEQYQLLLSQVFQTENISFVNQFFKSSLIKKRIVMLQKQKSKRIYQLKYLALVPLVVGMLFYTSCDIESKEENNIEATKLKKLTSGVPFVVIDEVPVFPGCENAEDKRACFQEKMQEHIRNNFKYPMEAQELGLQGRVNIMFTILKDGNIGNIRYRSPHKLLEEEALRIIKKLPKMTAGKQEGKTVNTPFSIPISFRLHGDSDVIYTGEESESSTFPITSIIEGDNVKYDLGEIESFIIDGKVSTQEEVAKIDPNEIEVINILKGENNNVIDITTKKED